MEKLLVVISMLQRSNGSRLFKRAFPSIIVIVGLTIVVSIMTSIMLLIVFYTAYFALLNCGMEPQSAMIVIFVLSLITIVLLIVLILLGLRHLLQMPQTTIKQSGATSCATDMLASFIEGFRAG